MIESNLFLKGLTDFQNDYLTVSLDATTSLNKVEFSHNTYESNFVAGGEGLLDIRGVRRVHFDNEEFKNNGDIINSIKLKFGTYEVSGTGEIVSLYSDEGPDISLAVEDISVYFMKALVYVESCHLISMTNIEATNNFLFEFSHYSSENERAIFLYTSNIFG